MTRLTLEGSWASFLEGIARDRFEREALPAYLTKQRWFAGKARTIEATRVDDATAGGVFPGQVVLLFVEVGYEDGSAELYFLPVQALEGPIEDGRTLIAKTGRTDGTEGTLGEALADDETCRALLAMIEKEQSIATHAGLLRGSPTSVFADVRGPAEEAPAIARGKAEQSNSAVIYGDRLIMKVFRRLEPGLNPDYEIGRFLSERGSFDRIPKYAGIIEYDRRGLEPITLAILQQLVANEGTGWEHALGVLARHYEAIGRRDGLVPAGLVPGRDLLELVQEDPPSEVVEAIGAYFPSAATLGRRTAELHLALASEPNDPAFAPEPLVAADLENLARQAREQAERAWTLLRPRAEAPGDPVGDMARRVIEGVPALLDRLERLDPIEPSPAKIRCHGDYHLGQVLWTGGDFILLDFEGEPAKSLAKRREKQSPIKDVVGMLRSFDYAANAALFTFAKDRPEEFERLAPWARGWTAWASAAFLRQYLETAAGAAFLPDAAGLSRLLQLLIMDKALYELLYELNNRPDWVRIPLRGLVTIVEQGRGSGTGGS